MAETAVLTKSGYARLVQDLRGIIEAGKKRAQAAASRELVQTYWEVGKRIQKEGLTKNARYGDSVLEDLAEDLGLGASTLRESVLFFKVYLDSRPWEMNLSWSQLRRLSTISSDVERGWYETRASEEGWTRDELVSAMKRDAYGTRSESRSNVKLRRPKDATYVYKTEVLDVVDGDTLVARINLGFTVEKTLRLRLAQIDCPPIKTQKGREAFEFVRDRLARVPFIVIRTTQLDVHGRYVADVFYSFEEGKAEKVFTSGRYLNQELVSRGLATRL